MFTSTVYKIYNDSTVAKSTLETMQLCKRSIRLLKRIPTTDGCNKKM